jgi:hypothetical protein
MRWWAFLLGRSGYCSLPAAPEADYRAGIPIARTVEAASRRLPFRVVCLPRAIATHLMLRRRGIASTLFIGLRPAASDAGIEMHAWVSIGSHPIPFEKVHTYVGVSAFA